MCSSQGHYRDGYLVTIATSGTPSPSDHASVLLSHRALPTPAASLLADGLFTVQLPVKGAKNQAPEAKVLVPSVCPEPWVLASVWLQWLG